MAGAADAAVSGRAYSQLTVDLEAELLAGHRAAALEPVGLGLQGPGVLDDAEQGAGAERAGLGEASADARGVQVVVGEDPVIGAGAGELEPRVLAHAENRPRERVVGDRRRGPRRERAQVTAPAGPLRIGRVGGRGQWHVARGERAVAGDRHVGSSETTSEARTQTMSTLPLPVAEPATASVRDAVRTCWTGRNASSRRGDRAWR